MSNVAVLLGIIFGFVLSMMMNEVSLAGLYNAKWFAIVTPFALGTPVFDPISILTMTAVVIIVFIESMGMFLALGEIVGRKLTPQDIVRGLRVDGVGTLFGGIFNSFPHTHFAKYRPGQRRECIVAGFASSGGILITFGMSRKWRCWWHPSHSSCLAARGW
jgi:xanthine/uracil permease